MKNIIWHIRAVHPPIILVTLGLYLNYLVWSELSSFVKYPLGLLLAFLTVVAFWDGVNRYLEFRGVRRIIKTSITDESIIRILNRSSTTWCTREAAKAALGSRISSQRFSLYKNFYRKRGYMIFHIFPDGTFTKRSPWLKGDFYRKTFLNFLTKKKKGHEK